jgi:hypothetical protein
MPQHETALPAKTSGKVVQSDVHNGIAPNSAFGGVVAPDHAEISNDDHLSDYEMDNEPDDVLSPLPSSTTHYSNLDFQSETSYWSMEHTKKKKLRDILVGTALILLFAAGVMRTSVPSLLYTILAVQALYSGRRAGIKSLFPIFVVGITAAIAAGMMLVHFIVNHTSADHSPLLLQVLLRAPTSLSNSFTYLPFQLLGSCIISRSSTGRVYVSFLSDALALAAAFVLFLGHLLHPASDTSTSAASVSGSPPRPRALSISAAASSSA